MKHHIFFQKCLKPIFLLVYFVYLTIPFFLLFNHPLVVAQDTQDTLIATISDEDISSMGVQWKYHRPDNSPDGNSTSWKLRWSPDGEKLAIVYFDNTVVILNGKTGKVINALGTAAPVILEPESSRSRCWGYTTNPLVPLLRACAWSPDSNLLAVAGDHRLIEIYNTSTWESVKVLEGHAGSILSLDWSPDGSRLASGEGTDQILPHNQAECKYHIKIWNITTFEEELTLIGHTDSVISVSWSKDSSKLVSASDDRNLRMWYTNNGSLMFILGGSIGHTAGVLDVDWSPNQTRLVSGSRDFKIRLWDALTGTPIGDPWKDHNCVRSVHWHPESRYIATAGVDQSLKIREAGTGKEIKIFSEAEETNSEVMSARWSPDGRAIAVCSSRDSTVRLYAIGFEVIDEREPDWVIGISLCLIIGIIGLIFIFLPLRSELRERRK